MPSNDLMDLFRAAVREDWGSVDRLLAELDRSGWPGGVQGITAVFGIAVNEMFRPGQDQQQISGFVSKVRAGLTSTDDIPQQDAEALICAALGETELAERVSAEVAIHAQIVLALRIFAELHVSETRLEAMLEEAEGLAIRWARQSGTTD